MKEKNLSELVFERFSLYHRCVNKLFHQDNKEITDSRELSRLLNIDPSLIRRDLSMIGKMGKRGMGYSLNSLKSGTENFLGKEKSWSVAVVGIGNLGKAILRYLAYSHSNYIITALFDTDNNKIGQEYENIIIRDFSKIHNNENIEIGVITAPASVAQEIADRLIESGIKAILNFAPIKLNLPEHIFYREIDLIRELDILTGMIHYYTQNSSENEISVDK